MCIDRKQVPVLCPWVAMHMSRALADGRESVAARDIGCSDIKQGSSSQQLQLVHM